MSTLLLLKRHAEKDQLRIILTEGSIDEHPTLYKSLVRYIPHKINMNKNGVIKIIDVLISFFIIILIKYHHI